MNGIMLCDKLGDIFSSQTEAELDERIHALAPEEKEILIKALLKASYSVPALFRPEDEHGS